MLVLVPNEALVIPSEQTRLAQTLRSVDDPKEERTPKMLWPFIFPPSNKMKLVGKKRSFQQMTKRSLSSLFVINRMADLLDK